MSEVTHQQLKVNGIELHVAIQGEGQPVIMCHGMPGLWFSWLHQMQALADAGYQAIAFDQRGYGRSERPISPAEYDSHKTVADVIGIMDALGFDKAALIGIDFGAAQVYNVAIRHPDRVSSVIGMACPYDFDFSGRGGAGSQPPKDAQYSRVFALPDKSPNQCFAEIAQHQFFYAHYYQEIGPAEKELGAQPELFLKRLMWALSAEGDLLDQSHIPENPQGYLDVLADPKKALPWSWLSDEDLQYYVDEFVRGGEGKEFIGGINSYRVANKNWEINADYADANIAQPSLFICGADDPVLMMIDQEALAIFQSRSDDLRGIHLIEGAGHFVQQEKPEQTNEAILAFLNAL